MANEIKGARQASAKLGIRWISRKSAPVKRQRLPRLLRIVTLLPKLVGLAAKLHGIGRRIRHQRFVKNDAAAAGATGQQNDGKPKCEKNLTGKTNAQHA